MDARPIGCFRNGRYQVGRDRWPLGVPDITRLARMRLQVSLPLLGYRRVGFSSPMWWWKNLNLQNSWLSYQPKGRLGHNALTYPLQVHARPWSDMLICNFQPVRPMRGPHLGSTCPLLEGCQHELNQTGMKHQRWRSLTLDARPVGCF